MRHLSTFLKHGCIALLLLVCSACGGPTQEPYGGKNMPSTPEEGELLESIHEKPSIRTIPVESEAIAPADAGPFRIGLLLPLSGKSAELGQSMLDAAMLSLQDKYNAMSSSEKNNKQIIILPKDTQGTAEGAMYAAQQVIRDGAQIILGPVYGTSLRSAAPIALANNVNIIAFSNDKTVAGNNVFLMGFLPEQQIARVVNYAIGQGKRKLAALLPNDTYGTAVASAFEQAISASGGQVVKIQYYDAGGSDLDAALRQLFAVNAAPEPSEYLDEGAYKNIEDFQRAQHANPTISFDALLVPVGGAQLKQVTDTMVGMGVDLEQLQLLGSGQWDDAGLHSMRALKGAWFASSVPEQRLLFERHFERFYGYKPLRLASLPYDAVALVSTLAFTSGNIDMSAQTLTSPNGFNGPVDGIFRFTSGGVAQRGLAVMEVTPQGFAVIDAAPEYFR